MLPIGILRGRTRVEGGESLVRTVTIAELVPAGSSGPAQPDPNRPPWPGRHHTIGGGDIFVRETPATGDTAEPALYVHGLGGASTNFTDLADLMSPWWEGLSLDLPGFGQSGPAVRDDYSIQAHTDIVVEAIEAAGRGAVHLVGNSMGGAISIRLAATRPDLVRTLTLISPAVPDLRVRQRSDLMLPIVMAPGVGMRALQSLDHGSPERRARAVIELCFAHPERVPANRLAEAAADVSARRELEWAHRAMLASLRGLAAMYLNRGPSSAWRLMRRISAPTLVVWGTRDRLVHVSNAAKVARAIPNASLLVLDDIGHVAQLEDPVTTARAICGLLGRVGEQDSGVGVGA